MTAVLFALGAAGLIGVAVVAARNQARSQRKNRDDDGGITSSGGDGDGGCGDGGGGCD